MKKHRKPPTLQIEVEPVGEMTQTPASHCPHCGVLLDAVTATIQNPNDLPEPGSLTICIKCGELAEFDEHMQLIKPTPELSALVASDPEFAAELDRLSRQIRESVGVVVVRNRPDGPIQ